VHFAKVSPARAVLILLGALLGLGFVWLIVTAILVRSQVSSIKGDLPALRADISAGNLDGARAKAAEISSAAHSAHGLTSGPAWWVAAQVPWLGEPAQVVRGLTAQADAFGHGAVPGVLDLADKLGSGGFRHGASIDLGQLSATEPTLSKASGQAGNALQKIEALPDETWLSPVDHARASFESELSTINGELANATTALKLLPDALGQQTPKRYFLGFENESEARGIGGIPGQFAILLVDHGRLTFEHFGPDDELRNLGATVDLPADYLAAYGESGPTEEFADSALSPNFPYAAKIWAADWQKKSGQRIDGAIAIDPTALSYLLAVTGPATTPDGRVVSASNVVALTQQVVYSAYPDPAVRKVYLVGVAKALADKISSGGNTRHLLTALAKSASQRRLLLWSADPSTEQFLDSTAYAGTVDSEPGSYSGFFVNNAAGTKLDYYLRRSMTYERSSCGPNSVVTAILTVHNGAPSSGLPSYVASRADSSAAASKPGDNRLLVNYLGTAGSKVTSVTLDGKPIPVFIGTENRLTLVITDVELPVGATRTIAVHLQEPAASRPPTVLRQPLVSGLPVAVSGSTCR
jgi:hypothetical protein